MEEYGFTPTFLRQKKRGKKHKKDGLESKVFKFKPSKDQHGHYIPYCNFGFHRGLIQDEAVCIVRRCPNYYKLRIYDF